jgi:hypothetical protein
MIATVRRNLEKGVRPRHHKPLGELQVWFANVNEGSTDWHGVSAVKLTSAEPLTPTKLQRFPWAKMLAVADAGLRQLEAVPRGQGEEADDAAWKALRRAFGDDFGNPDQQRRRRPGRRGHPDEFYQAVAKRYVELRAQGVTDPTNRIAREKSYNRSTVAGWVSTARKKDYLPPPRRGRPG